MTRFCWSWVPGPGKDWEILNQSYDVVGSDNSKEFLSRLIAEHPDGQFLELDAITLDTDKKFDGIYSNKVLHHLKDDEIAASILRQYELLKPSGIVCHSFWKGTGDEIYMGMTVNYHTEESIRNGWGDLFEILLIESYKEFEEGDSLLLMARKK